MSVKYKGVGVLWVKVKKGIHIMVKVKEVTKPRKSLVMRFDVRWLKDTVEVSNNQGELMAAFS